MSLIPQTKKIVKKRPKKPREEYCTFIVEIIDWELPYSFSINHNVKYCPSHYSEHLHMHIKGLLREPKKFGGKEIEAIFIGQRSLIPEVNNRASTDKPKCVGSITMRGEFRQFIGDLPFDSLPMIASRLENKQLRYIQLHGPSPYRGTALTTEIRFFKDYDPEDY